MNATLAIRTLALVLALSAPVLAVQPLTVTYASLATRTKASGGGICRAEAEFTEPQLDAIRDDEADVQVSIVDRDGHGAHRRLYDLEDCRLLADGAMTCPGGAAFERVSKDPPRWRIVLGLSSQASGTLHAPVTVRFSYAVSGGPETVRVGTIRDCKPRRGGATLVCGSARSHAKTVQRPR